MNEFLKVLLLAFLIAMSFLAGVLTSNYQTRQIIDETKKTAIQVKLDLEEQIAIQREEFEKHRKRDAIHICLASLEHLDNRLDLRRLARRAGHDVKDISTRLRPEVIGVCAETDVDLEDGRG